jgi:hypothetical protein
MTRRFVAAMFIIYFLMTLIISALMQFYGTRFAINAATVGEIIGGAFAIYFLSGMLPFAFWGARGFPVAKAASLFVPWAVLAAFILFLIEYGRG